MQDSLANITDLSLRAENLRCERGDVVLFEGLHVDLGPAEVLQVKGANGSGKTSLLRILCGLSQPDDGYVSWCGRDIQEYRAEYHRELVYVGHTNAIKADLNVLENLQSSRAISGHPEGLSLQEVIARMSLEEHVDVPAGRLSSGQKRRLAFARLLSVQSRLWILDEPLNSLDADSRKKVCSCMMEHVRGGGSVILTSHEDIDWQANVVKEVSL